MTTLAERASVRAAVFTCGAVLMALEVGAFRIIGRSFGTAIRETTVVIAVFLVAMSIGYWLGGRMGDRHPTIYAIAVVMLAAGGATLLIPLIDRQLSRSLVAGALPLSLHAFVATVTLFAIPVCLLAAMTPIAVRLLSRDVAQSGSVAGGISALSTVGSVAGSILTAFFLLDWLQSIDATVRFLGSISISVAVLLIVAHARQFVSVRARWYATAAVASVGVTVILGIAARPMDLSGFEEPNARYRLIYARDSPYHRVSVREHDGKRRDLLFDLNVESRMPLGNPAGPGLEYTNYFHIGRLLRPHLRRVLFIGLGGGTGPRQFAAMYPDVTIDAVDVDPVVVDVAQRFFAVQPGPRLKLHTQDGRVFLQRTTESWDLIVIDAYTVNEYGSTIPPHLCTREFFELAAAHLTPDGLLHFHCAASRIGVLPRALYKTLRIVFPSVDVFGSAELIASKRALQLQKAAIVAGARELLAAGVWHDPKMVDRVATMVEIRPPTLDVPILTDDYAPVDLLFRRSHP
jgi:spermidine synthase